MPAAASLTRGCFETFVEEVAKKSSIPSRTVLLNSEGTAPGDIPWREVGEFEHCCQDCGEVSPPVTFLVNTGSKVRYVHRGEHQCAIVDDEEKLHRARMAAMEALADPSKQRLSQVRQWTGLPSRFHPGVGALAAHPHLEKAMDAAGQIVALAEGDMRPEKGLYLWSKTPGTGKTALLKALTFDLAHRTGKHCPPGWDTPLLDQGRHLRVTYWPVQELVEEWAKYHREEETRYYPALIEKADVVCLDDLGKESGTAPRLGMLFGLFDRALEQGQMLMITSQYSPKGLKERMLQSYGQLHAETIQALISRLGALVQPICCEGPSLR